jgi:aspartate ammonia-lyase
MARTTRLEHDFLGEREIPDDRYYGVQTSRALENFPITGIAISTIPELVRALAQVKKAAALANGELGIIPEDVARVICAACDEIIAGQLHEHFPVDVIQGGAGTSTNMNANEVIANRALELLGRRKGEYQFVHPNNHVNCSQSTNDAYPTAFRIALHEKLGQLVEELKRLQKAFAVKGAEFADVLKMGRTQLQDAVPMTLGQEFDAYATTLGEDVERLDDARRLVLEINMGATAIGTGINAPPDYGPRVTAHLRRLVGTPLVASPNLIEATWDTGAYVQIAGVLKRVAVKTSKICNDLRLLSSGPRAGLGEINLPPLQPGSSIMPGKVNPVIPEVVNQVCYYAIGADLTVTLAAENGQLELNVMEPVIGYGLFTAISMMVNAFRVLRERCVDGITANRERCRALVVNSIGIVTALNPIIGYEASAAIAGEALVTGRSVAELVLEKKLVSRELLDEVLSTENLMHPRYINPRLARQAS